MKSKITKIKTKGTNDRSVPEPDPLPPLVCAQATDSIHIQVFLSYVTNNACISREVLTLFAPRCGVRLNAGKPTLLLNLLSVERISKRHNASFRDRQSQPTHEIGKIPEIMDRVQSRGQHLLNVIEMMKMGARIARADGAPASRINGRFVALVAGLLNQHTAETCEQPPGPSVAGRHHTVEQVDAASHSFDEILRHADAHQIARFGSRQLRHRHLQHAVHVGLAFADGESADCIPVELQPDEITR